METVGDLKRALNSFPDDAKISIAGNLRLYRCKKVGDNEVYLEFNEYEAFLSDELRRMIPEAKVIFCESRN